MLPKTVMLPKKASSYYHRGVRLGFGVKAPLLQTQRIPANILCFHKTYFIF